MPAQKRLWCDDQAVAPPPRKQLGERRKQSTIGWPQRGARLLPVENDELMSQHEQLEVFSELAAPVPNQQPQHSREGEVGERKEHAPMLSSPDAKGSKGERLWPGGGSPSVAKPSTIWYPRTRVDL